MLKYFRNRKSLGWLVGAFLLVLVIFAFVAFYIPDFLKTTGVSRTGEIAWVEGTPISSQEFLRSYRAQEQQYRQQLGPQFSPDLMRQLGFDNLVLRQLVQNQILLLEAERQGISVADQEVSDFILSFPAFQEAGKFIGRDAYLSLLAQNSLNASQFEAQLREDLMRQKLQSLVTDGVSVSEADLEEEYRRRNEKLHLEYAFVPKTEFEAQVQVTDEEARSFYDQNKKKFERPVQRKVRFITLTPQLFASAVSVSDREIERYYQQNSSRYETAEQVAASHILFKTDPGANEEEVRKKAEAVLAQAKAGADFAELARQYSEDTSAENGGDLGLFGRGQMVPEFEAAAFSLPEGQVSDLVRSTYGFHIIKVTGRQAAIVRPLDSVRDEIRNTLTQEKARESMEKAVDSAAQKLRASGSVDSLSAEYPVLVPQETNFFGRGDSVPQLGKLPRSDPRRLREGDRSGLRLDPPRQRLRFPPGPRGAARRDSRLRGSEGSGTEPAPGAEGDGARPGSGRGAPSGAPHRGAGEDGAQTAVDGELLPGRPATRGRPLGGGQRPGVRAFAGGAFRSALGGQWFRAGAGH